MKYEIEFDNNTVDNVFINLYHAFTWSENNFEDKDLIHNRTRAFVNKMNVLPCKLDTNGFDQIETEEAIRQFCTKHYFSREKEDTILFLFRAIVQKQIVKMVPKDDSIITFLIEYSEEPLKTEIKFFWNGEKCTEDLLAGISSEHILHNSLSYENGQNALVISLL